MTKKGPDSRNYHTVPSKNGWDVKQEGKSSPVSSHRTQEAAWKSTIKNAKASEGEAFKHKSDGSFGPRNTYRKDPFPPKG